MSEEPVNNSYFADGNRIVTCFILSLGFAVLVVIVVVAIWLFVRMFQIGPP
jgi:hypothetical protein